MTKTAKVKAIIGIREWAGNNGTVYYHKLEMDNGEIGEIGKKKNNAFQIGDSLTYTSEESQYGLKFKAAQENGFKGGFKSQGSPASFALSYSKDIIVAAMPFHQEKTVAEMTDACIGIAKKFHAFLKEHE
jgi:hypothetical protein